MTITINKRFEVKIVRSGYNDLTLLLTVEEFANLKKQIELAEKQGEKNAKV